MKFLTVFRQIIALAVPKLPATPSPRGVSVLNKRQEPTIFVVEPKLESEVIAQDSLESEEEQTPFLEHEIECPRCHDSMTLCSDFDSLYYVCEECDFTLYTIKKN